MLEEEEVQVSDEEGDEEILLCTAVSQSRALFFIRVAGVIQCIGFLLMVAVALSVSVFLYNKSSLVAFHLVVNLLIFAVLIQISGLLLLFHTTAQLMAIEQEKKAKNGQNI